MARSPTDLGSPGDAGRIPRGASTWIEISLDAIRNNFAAVAAHAGVPVCAVVKANAYGHGLVAVARTLADAGARMLAVTRWEEARELRTAGISTPVLLLTPIPADLIRDAIALDLTLCVASSEDLGPISAAAEAGGKRAHVHMKVNTGMGRLGVSPNDAVVVAGRAAGDDHISLEGIWTHFAAAGTASASPQIAAFERVRTALGKRAARTILHAANSAATIAHPEARYDMVRVGTLLYGLDPPHVRAPMPLEDPFSWFARIVSLRTVATGEGVGYGSEWRAGRPTRVATIPVGYADGFGLEPAARTESWSEAARAGLRVAAIVAGRRSSPRAVTVRGGRAPVVGRISMQQATVDVGDVPGVAVGDVVRIEARRLLVGSHIERVYVNDGG